MFIIEDEIHAEPQGQFISFEEALHELRKRAKLPWNEPPNRAPCTNWLNCERSYEIIEYDDTISPWREINRIHVLDISKSKVLWAKEFQI